MLTTKYGTFDGDSWENLCQIILKHRFGKARYQEMPASPGDFGIEGFIRDKNIAYQCYCPNENYTSKELYEKQRDKITTDLNKLKKFENPIAERIGNSQIDSWIFLTPIVNHNDLLKHAVAKEQEIRSWRLSILSSNITVTIQDADFYANDINNIRINQGDKLYFLDGNSTSSRVTEDKKTEYEENIDRKNRIRCTENGTTDSDKLKKLNRITLHKWTDGESLLQKIEKDAPEVFFKITRTINQYEAEIEETCLTWKDDPETLINRIREELTSRIRESIPCLGEAEKYKISDHMTSKWIALCPLNIEP